MCFLDLTSFNVFYEPHRYLVSVANVTADEMITREVGMVHEVRRESSYRSSLRRRDREARGDWERRRDRKIQGEKGEGGGAADHDSYRCIPPSFLPSFLQVLTQYGPVHRFWFDGTSDFPDKSKEGKLWDAVYHEIRTTSPRTMISSYRGDVCASTGTLYVGFTSL